MRAVASFMLAVIFQGCVAVGQSASSDNPPTVASVCAIVEHPEQYEGQSVTVRARYSINWEWGSWIGEDHCNKALDVVVANRFSKPEFLSHLSVRKDAAFDSFTKQARDLCNGMSALCEFDYLEADFTGVIVAPGHFPELPNPQATVLVVTAIATPKLHRDEHPMGTSQPPLPSTIPESNQP